MVSFYAGHARWAICSANRRRYPYRVTGGRAFVSYTLLRFLLLAVVGGVLYLVGARGILLLVGAFLLSGLLSLVLLDRQRSETAAGLDRAVTRVNKRIDDAAAAEDSAQDATGDQSADEEPEAESQQRG